MQRKSAHLPFWLQGAFRQVAAEAGRMAQELTEILKKRMTAQQDEAAECIQMVRRLGEPIESLQVRAGVGSEGDCFAQLTRHIMQLQQVLQTAVACSLCCCAPAAPHSYGDCWCERSYRYRAFHRMIRCSLTCTFH